jgi:mannosyltransferase OCH1-like enzyme
MAERVAHRGDAIPRIIHRIWLGAPMPPDVARFGKAWQRLHGGWTVRTWRDWDMPALQHQRWFDEAESPAQRADIVRLELLHRYGGVYVDTDFEPLRPLDDLLGAVRCFLASEDGHWLATGIMGAVPGHPFIADLVEGIPASIAANWGAPPNRQTGPQYVSGRYWSYTPGGGEDAVVVFPPSMFYPYHFSEPERRFDSFPDAYAVHHWSRSWATAADGWR